MANIQRTKIGTFMYNIITKTSIKLTKHKVLYYVLNYTWGIITSFVGLLISLVMLCCGRKLKRFNNVWYFEIFDNWGGMEMGTMFLKDKTSSVHTMLHETGHSYQNAILGPFFIFLVAIPSAIRYWYRRFAKNIQTSYDTIWFEGSATTIGYSLKEDK